MSLLQTEEHDYYDGVINHLNKLAEEVDNMNQKSIKL